MSSHERRRRVERGVLDVEWLDGHVLGVREDDLFYRVRRVVQSALGSAHAADAWPLRVGQPAVLVVDVQTVVALHNIRQHTSPCHRLQQHTPGTAYSFASTTSLQSHASHHTTAPWVGAAIDSYKLYPRQHKSSCCRW